MKCYVLLLRAVQVHVICDRSSDHDERMRLQLGVGDMQERVLCREYKKGIPYEIIYYRILQTKIRYCCLPGQTWNLKREDEALLDGQCGAAILRQPAIMICSVNIRRLSVDLRFSIIAIIPDNATKLVERKPFDTSDSTYHANNL